MNAPPRPQTADGADPSSGPARPAVFDAVVVHVPEWVGRCGGLAEVQVLVAGRNVAAAQLVDASGSVNATFLPQALTVRMTAGTPFKGYWLLPDNTPVRARVDVRGAAGQSGRR